MAEFIMYFLPSAFVGCFVGVIVYAVVFSYVANALKNKIYKPDMQSEDADRDVPPPKKNVHLEIIYSGKFVIYFLAYIPVIEYFWWYQDLNLFTHRHLITGFSFGYFITPGYILYISKKSSD